MNTNTLIVGAGPAGLTTALTLATHGNTNFKIVDKRSAVPDSTKAIVLWAGAMQVLDYLGVYDTVVDQATPLLATSYEFPSGLNRGINLTSYHSGFPHPALSVPQPIIERALETALAGRGIFVDRGVEVRSMVDGGADGVEVETTAGALRAHWVVGADGAHSAVREAGGISFDGTPLEDYFFLVDGVPRQPAQARARYLLDSPDSTVVSVPLPNGRARVFVRQDNAATPLSAETINDYLVQAGHADLLMESMGLLCE